MVLLCSPVLQLEAGETSGIPYQFKLAVTRGALFLNTVEFLSGWQLYLWSNKLTRVHVLPGSLQYSIII